MAIILDDLLGEAFFFLSYFTLAVQLYKRVTYLRMSNRENQTSL